MPNITTNHAITYTNLLGEKEPQECTSVVFVFDF